MRARIVAVVVGAVVACDSFGRAGTFPPTEREVGAAFAGTRPYVARLSGSATWAECPGGAHPDSVFVIRCTHGAASPGLVERAASLARAFRSSAHAPLDAGTLWSSGLLDLSIAGNAEGTVESIIARLEEAANVAKPPPSLLNDLAVAYMVRASTSHTAADLFLALELLELAIDDAQVPEVVLFNRAILLDRLGLVSTGTEAWQAYLRAARGDGWAVEARKHLDALVAREPAGGDSTAWTAADGLPGLVVADPQGARERVLGHLLPGWAAAESRGDSAGAARVFEAAFRVGATLATEVGDSSAALAVSEAHQLHRGRPEALATAMEAAARGTNAFERAEREAAMRHLEAAVRTLGRDAPSLAGWSEAILANQYMERNNDYRRAEAILDRIAAHGMRHGAWALAGRGYWGAALSRARRGDLGPAERDYAEAARAFERAREPGNRGRVLTQLGQVRLRLGRDDAALNDVLLGVQLLRSRIGQRARHDALVALGQQLQEAVMPRAALAAFREALATARQSVRKQDHVEALHYYASAEAQLKPHGGARQMLVEARALADQLDDARLRADVDLAEARLMSASEMDSALARVDSAESYFRAHGIDFVRYAAILLRARLRLLRADTSHAASDLVALARTLARPGPASGTEDDRRRQIELRREVFGELLGIALSRGDTVDALRTYAMLIGKDEGDAARFLREPVDSGVTVAAYAVLPGEVVLWTRRRDGIRIVRQPVARAQLAELTARFERSVMQSSLNVVARSAAGELARLLLDSVLVETAPGDELSLVLDGELRRLPFAALPADGGFLVERNVLRFPASLSGASRAGGGIPGVAGLRGLVVGRPAHDRRVFPELAELRYAQQEAATVAQLYPRAVAVPDTAATRQRLASELPRVSMLHFAGHARLSPSRSEQSHLVLASDGETPEDNALFAWEVAKLDLHRMKLVVLSSCGTTTQTSRRIAASHSLARAFLDAGADEVVSSLWEADDRTTADLMVAFHMALVSGKPTARALHEAQLGGLERERSGQGSSQWAAFRVDER